MLFVARYRCTVGTQFPVQAIGHQTFANIFLFFFAHNVYVSLRNFMGFNIGMYTKAYTNNNEAVVASVKGF